jgi:hypothetical protein
VKKSRFLLSRLNAFAVRTDRDLTNNQGDHRSFEPNLNIDTVQTRKNDDLCRAIVTKQKVVPLSWTAEVTIELVAGELFLN